MKTEQLKSSLGILCLSAGMWILSSQPGQSVSFTPPPDNATPTQGSGGASRGVFQFTPPSDNPAPRNGSGGASRSDTFFIPYPDSTIPSQQSGGTPWHGAFIPTPDNHVPENAISETSRTNDYGLVNEVLAGSSVSMLAITPPNFYGLTVSERPTFMTYLPTSTAHQAIFRLKNEAQVIVYEQVIPLNGEAGILTVKLPSDAPALTTNQYYRWFVTLQTEEHLTPASPFVDAWIKRIEPTDEIAQAQVSGDALTVAETLADAGIWYDTSAILARLQVEQKSTTMLDHWSELLSSVGLSDLAETPLLSGDSH